MIKFQCIDLVSGNVVFEYEFYEQAETYCLTHGYLYMQGLTILKVFK